MSGTYIFARNSGALIELLLYLPCKVRLDLELLLDECELLALVLADLILPVGFVRVLYLFAFLAVLISHL
jgi:hypothetical protein